MSEKVVSEKMEKVKEEKISRMESIWQILSVWLWITIIVWAELLCLIVFGYLVVSDSKNLSESA